MNLGAIVLFVFEAALVFVLSTLLFDVLHYLLHRWEHSRFAILRRFSAWHWVHHKFLDTNMDINPRYVRQNFWFHILPEYATSMLGTLVFLLVLPWPPIAAVAVLRTIMLVGTIREEGMDYNHMAMDRLDGQRPLWWVNSSYHALHHIYPHNFFSSFFNLFDLVAGTGQQISGRRFLVTGAGGAFGSAMVKRLEALGAVVETAKSGVDYSVGDYEQVREKLERADVLLLAHGARTDDCWNANYRTPVDLIEMFIDVGRTRLNPPEVWGVGSEVELHGDLGMDDLRDYAASKRAFARRARAYYTSRALAYRHIVPAAFTSAMGKGAMSADTAAAMALFFIKRGFTYVPVTYTTLAFWNYFRFRFWQKPEAGTLHPAE